MEVNAWADKSRGATHVKHVFKNPTEPSILIPFSTWPFEAVPLDLIGSDVLSLLKNSLAFPFPD